MRRLILAMGLASLLAVPAGAQEQAPTVVAFEQRGFERYSTGEPVVNGQVAEGTVTAEVWAICDRWGYISDVPLVVHFHTQRDRPDLYVWRTVHSNTYADCGDDGDRIASWQQKTFPGLNAIHAHGPGGIVAEAWWCGEAECEGPQ